MTSTTFSLAILSGKGGVGKSNIALNLGYGLHQSSHTVLFMDCDMGLANIDVLLGITPTAYLQDILISGKSPQEVLYPIGANGAEGFDLIPANSGMASFSELDSDARNTIRDKINPIASDYDFLILDIGAGISQTALGFASMASARVVIVTPEPTSLTDSYALMKIIATKHKRTDFLILVNQVESSQEAQQTFKRLSTVCQRFLGFSPKYLGKIRFDASVSEAVRKQKPFMQITPKAPASIDCSHLVDVINNLRMRAFPFPDNALPLRSESE